MAGLLWGALGTFLILGALMFALLAYRLFRASGSAYHTAHDITGSISNVVKGRVPTHKGGARDHRVAAGLSLNLKDEWQVEGQLADETVQAVVGKR